MSEIYIEQAKLKELNEIPKILNNLGVKYLRLKIPKVYKMESDAKTLFMQVDIYTERHDYHFAIRENIPVGRLSGEIYYAALNVKRMMEIKETFK